MIEITEEIATKVLTIVDAGLSSGLGKPKPGEMCVEAAVCYVLGQPHSDQPACVSKALRAFKIGLNDSDWSDHHARAMGLRRLALAQLDSDSLDEVLFVTRLAILAEKWAHGAGGAARGAPATATYAASAATYAASAAASADAAADAARAAAYGADAAATYAASAAASAARAATYAASAAAYVARAAAYVARGDAATTDAAADAIARTVRNESLANAAEDVVQLLIEMNAPGARWLALAPLNT
jgi:hypothetical protein